MKKYIVKKDDLLSVLGIKSDSALSICVVMLTDEQALQMRSFSKYIEEPKIIETSELADIDYEKNRSAWIKFKKKNITGRGIKVAVLDNGIAIGYFPVDFSVNFTSDGDIGNHGTMTASIIRDLAPDCILYAIKVISAVTTEADIIEGLNYCALNGIHIINMSFTTTKSTPLDTAFSDLHNLGIVMFASSGNNGSPADILYPAWHDKVVAVNAVKEDETVAYQNWLIPSGGTHGIHIACSGYGSKVVDMNGSVYGNNGTSFSSPFAAGIAALTLEEIGVENIGKLRQILFNKATKNSNTTAFGFGILNC